MLKCTVIKIKSKSDSRAFCNFRLGGGGGGSPMTNGIPAAERKTGPQMGLGFAGVPSMRTPAERKKPESCGGAGGPVTR